VECYIANVNQPASDLFALEAICLITEYLPVAVKDGSNLDARTKLAWASTEAGICESLSCCIAHHSMEHAISAYYPDVPHGAGLTMLSVAFFSYVAERNPERFENMARAMGEEVDSLSEDQKPFAFITGLKKLIKNIGLDDETLSNYGVKKEDIPKLAENSMHAMGFLYDLTPVALTIEDTIAIFERAYE
jgi:alcohol dehydrogenase